MYGASGGAALRPTDNQLNNQSRGLGVHLVANMADNIPPNTTFIFVPPRNGADASLNASGSYLKNQMPSERAGSGGTCPGNPQSRYAGAGGTAACIICRAHTAVICLGGGGGSGAYAIGGFSKGGNAPFVPPGKGVQEGFAGSPRKLSGAGGMRKVAGVGGPGHDGTAGQGGTVDFKGGGSGGSGYPEYSICLAGGGGGSGIRGGGGGGARSANNTEDGPNAGSGGSGSSAFKQDRDTFTNIQQEHAYSEDPRIIISFDVTPPIEGCGVSCTLMKKRKRNTKRSRDKGL